MYSVPEEYQVRLHHVRPRFKKDIESVLLYMAGEISKLPELPCKEFAKELDKAIFLYPGNSIKKKKTLDNWRTEIPALFGFIIDDGITSKAGTRAKELSEKGDLVESFKTFLYSFQYPGAFMKSHKILDMIEEGVRFKPAQMILRVLQAGEKASGSRVGISKVEVCHCMFTDLRCVRDNEDPLLTWNRIVQNRKDNVIYDATGDIVRYAGDIIDYLEIANLLRTYNGKMYYTNTLESETILKFVNSNEWFSEYDAMVESRNVTLEQINACEKGWFSYVNRDMGETDFSTDILAYISSDADQYEELRKKSAELFESLLEKDVSISTKDIGDMGESLIHSHECQRIKEGGRAELIHLIQRAPTGFPCGYDVLSIELDERKRYIEVKTTISNKPLTFNKIHLTLNEWNAASSNKDRYFIYRLAISKKERKLFVIQDPVFLYKNDIVDMVPRDGVEIIFNTDTAGKFEELLSWKN